MNGGFQLAYTDRAQPHFTVVRLTGCSPSQVIHFTVQYAELGPNSPSEPRGKANERITSQIDSVRFIHPYDSFV